MSTTSKFKKTSDSILTNLYHTKWSVKHWFDDRKWFWKNLIAFHKDLTEYRPWDYQHSLNMFAKSLELLRDGILEGPEVVVMTKKKASAINELVELLRMGPEKAICNNVSPLAAKSRKDYAEIINMLHNDYFSKMHRLLAGEPDADFEKRFNENIEKYKAMHNGEEPDVFDIADETKDGTCIMNWWC